MNSNNLGSDETFVFSKLRENEKDYLVMTGVQYDERSSWEMWRLN
jgi:hypothetical protein